MDTSFAIPEGVTSIGEDAFGKCSALTSVTIPDSVTHIGEGAFIFCTSLRSLTVPASVVVLDYPPFSSELLLYVKKDSEAWRYAKDTYMSFVEIQ